jgi:hypothetical protein
MVFAGLMRWVYSWFGVAGLVRWVGELKSVWKCAVALLGFYYLMTCDFVTH